jgi:hypothetical protein
VKGLKESLIVFVIRKFPEYSEEEIRNMSIDRLGELAEIGINSQWR